MPRARQEGHTVEHVGPFVVLLHPTDEALDTNVALLQQPALEVSQQWLEELQVTFAAHGRVPAIRWIAADMPHLAASLQAAGFREQLQDVLLICTPQTLRSPAPLPGLTFVTLTETASLADVREGLDINEFGFDPTTAQPATEEQAERFRTTLGAARAFTARLDGEGAGAGMYTPPYEGVTELTGIATLDRFRGRGIATALTAYMAQSAFTQSCDLVFLTTANPIARRAYERAGFQQAGMVLTYLASRRQGADSEREVISR
jgi:ribosomal protein S18 acetylase RimI-like enzyme